MADEEQLLHEAQESREATERLREASGLDDDESEPGAAERDEEVGGELPDSPPEPGAKTSSGDTDTP